MEGNAHPTEMTPPSLQRSVVLYDGECGFCRRHIERWRALSRDAIEYVPFQESRDRFPKIPEDDLKRALHLVEPNASIRRGAEAVFRIAALSRKRPSLWWSYRHLPGFKFIAESAYAWIAAHRDFVDPVDRVLFGSNPEPLSYRLTRVIYLRALGIIYLIAFISLWTQIHGLIGSQGILPIADAMHGAHPTLEDWLRAPTLLWLNQSDGFLTFLCAGGVTMSALLIIGVLPIVMLVGLWVFYLSLVIGGQDFLSFQWDSLLLEAGFASIFFAPMQLLLNWRKSREPPRIVLWLLRWLMFRFMFLSGMTKLVSGDESWTNATALTWHYWTQPLPPWTAWYFNRAPLWFNKSSVLLMFFCELVVPFFIFTPRMTRRLAFWGIVMLQVAILITGNYGIFNIFTIVLCIPLLDDAFFPKRMRRDPTPYRPHRPLVACLFAAPALVLVLITIVAFAGECRWNIGFPEWMQSLHDRSLPFRSANGYGLFRVMTKQRYEIVIEGSDDGEHWKIYDFKYKPGDINRRPMFLTPHMPRLDWQMWFAALDNHPPRWFIAFLTKLLQGSPQVTGLLKTNPFPDHPPKYVHALLYDYHFADDPNGKAWWKRTLLGEYVPMVSLRR
jgi:predicted DCC family thiol-disulfide oxidoreductase YuxK